MPEENVFTDIEQTLKTAIESRLSLGGQPVPLRIVTPDPDYIELELPCVTLQLSDVRRDPPRIVNERRVEKDLDAMTAEIRPRTEPFNLHYVAGIHAGHTRDGRLLIEQLLLLIDERPLIITEILGREVYLSRDLSFSERSNGRDFFHAFTLIVKTRLEPGEAETVPLVSETAFSAKEV